MENILTPVDVLKDYDVGALTIKKLKKYGIGYLEDLLLYNPEELTERCNLRDEVLARKVINRARIALTDKGRMKRGIQSFGFFEKAYSRREFFTTRIKKFDDVLGGGIQVQDIYKFAGEFGQEKLSLHTSLS